MINSRTIGILFVILLLGCSQSQDNHTIFQYYPDEGVFEEGYVSKYYVHYYPDNTDRSAATEIGYTKYVKLGQDHFKTESYNAGYEFTGERFYAAKNDSLVVERGTNIQRNSITDTTSLNILNGTLSVWKGEPKTPYRIQYEYDNQGYIYTEGQLSALDTLIDNKPSKVFSSFWNYRKVGSDSLFNEGTTKSYYVKNLGFFGSNSKGADYSRHVELIEQMSIEEFERRANHHEYRVAYIDPKKSLSDDSNFTLCHHIKRVADYYNSTPQGQYIDGKRAMLDKIYDGLDETKLVNQTGYLVFRFVVNCNGEAGRFIAEGYNLDYQQKDFQPETIDHLLELLQGLETWQPVVIRDEPRDAYFYINFKLDNGEIIDILP